MTTSNDPPEILIALGANMPSRAGPPAQTLKAALAALGDAGVGILKVSSFRQTPAWPDPSEPAFTNAVTYVATSLQPVALLELLHSIETAWGRVRSTKNANRTLDLDLLAHGDAIMAEPALTLPHPAIAGRRFVLEPLAEVAPCWRHPVNGLTAAQMLARLVAAPVQGHVSPADS